MNPLTIREPPVERNGHSHLTPNLRFLFREAMQTWLRRTDDCIYVKFMTKAFRRILDCQPRLASHTASLAELLFCHAIETFFSPDDRPTAESLGKLFI